MGTKKDDKKKLQVKRTAISNLTGVGGGRGAGGGRPRPNRSGGGSGGGGSKSGGHNVSEKLTQATEISANTVQISVGTFQLTQSTSGGGQQ